MIDWYVQTKKLIRALSQKAADARAQCPQDNSTTPEPLKGYMVTDLRQLKAHWLGRYPDDEDAFRDLGRHVGFCMGKDCSDIQAFDLPALDERAERYLQRDGTRQKIGFEDLLHPAITASSYDLYSGGHLREAVLNSITALFDHIRHRTKTDEDGDRLIGKVFSLEKPLLMSKYIECVYWSEIRTSNLCIGADAVRRMCGRACIKPWTGRCERSGG